jgi:hypothetical protein
MNEDTPILTKSDDNSTSHAQSKNTFQRFRTKLGHIMESRVMHILVLILIVVDILCILAEIICSLFELDKSHEEALALQILWYATMVITCLFVVEILAHFIAFGWRYFFLGRHWILHSIDAIVIFTTIGLELGLRGKEREIAGLLILFRLWRVSPTFGFLIM